MNTHAGTKYVVVLGRGEEKMSLSEPVSVKYHSKCDSSVKGRVRRERVMYF